MKKNLKYIIILLILIVIVIVVIVLFNKNHIDIIKCDSDAIKGDNYVINDNYEIYYNKDIVSKVLIVRTVESKNNTVLSFFENNYKEEFEKYNDSYGGYSISSTIDNGKMVMNIEFDLNKVNIDNLKNNNPYLKNDIKKGKLYLDGIYKLYNLDKNKCR